MRDRPSGTKKKRCGHCLQPTMFVVASPKRRLRAFETAPPPAALLNLPRHRLAETIGAHTHQVMPQVYQQGGGGKKRQRSKLENTKNKTRGWGSNPRLERWGESKNLLSRVEEDSRNIGKTASTSIVTNRPDTRVTARRIESPVRYMDGIAPAYPHCHVDPIRPPTRGSKKKGTKMLSRREITTCHRYGPRVVPQEQDAFPAARQK